MTTAAYPETPFTIDPREMADAAVNGFLTGDGATSVIVTAVRAATTVTFTGWLLRRYGRRRAIAVTRIWLPVSGANHAKLEMLAIIDGDLERERALHKKFKAHHIKGEWFHLDASILRYLKSVKKVDPKD